MDKIIKRIIVIAIVILVLIGMCSCASLNRTIVDVKSEIGNGLNRVINIYTYDGKLINTVKGEIDIEMNDSKVKFDSNGKRYVYYNCLVETIADI